MNTEKKNIIDMKLAYLGLLCILFVACKSDKSTPDVGKNLLEDLQVKEKIIDQSQINSDLPQHLIDQFLHRDNAIDRLKTNLKNSCFSEFKETVVLNFKVNGLGNASDWIYENQTYNVDSGTVMRAFACAEQYLTNTNHDFGPIQNVSKSLRETVKINREYSIKI